MLKIKLQYVYFYSINSANLVAFMSDLYHV